LDELVAIHDVVDLKCLKLDVEGAEAEVLRGGEAVLKRHHPVVIFEAGRAEPQEAVFALLRRLEYSEFWDETTFGSPAPVLPRLAEPITNIVAVSSRDAARVRTRLTVTQPNDEQGT
jgi:hypothetical protein